MSAICILTPVVLTAWPGFSAAVLAAASSLGYSAVAAQKAENQAQRRENRRIDLEVPQSQIVTDPLARDQRITVARDGVTVVFARDARGRATVCVTGAGRTEEELRGMGEELSRRVVQKYVYQRLVEEMQSRQFLVVDEHTDENQAIHIKVRHWEQA